MHRGLADFNLPHGNTTQISDPFSKWATSNMNALARCSPLAFNRIHTHTTSNMSGGTAPTLWQQAHVDDASALNQDARPWDTLVNSPAVNTSIWLLVSLSLSTPLLDPTYTIHSNGYRRRRRIQACG
jgi:hypothetical protein